MSHEVIPIDLYENGSIDPNMLNNADVLAFFFAEIGRFIEQRRSRELAEMITRRLGHHRPKDLNDVQNAWFDRMNSIADSFNVSTIGDELTDAMLAALKQTRASAGDFTLERRAINCLLELRTHELSYLTNKDNCDKNNQSWNKVLAKLTEDF